MGTITNKFIIMCSILFRISAIGFAQNTTAFFIFGDSLVEVGNNYYIDTLAKPSFPNGIDFPRGTPSGRFTNSRIITDIIGEELGFQDYTPPFLAPNTTGDTILKGVNYASSGAGILQAPGSLLGERIWMDKQVDYFAKTRQDIISRIGASAAQALLRNSLYFLAIGSNDILFGEYATLDKNGFTDEVVSSFKSQITTLQHGSVFVYIDGYAVTDDIINNSRSYGFENIDYACCEVIGRHGGLIPCTEMSRVCSDRKKYIFWDPFHPTESAILIAAKYMLDGGPEYVSPINIRQLANS
ncbi:GDSL esterase/lipase At4g16230-like [Hibiscus syriacus]|uniref:GDSL esterase/lipase At4g16230-like n=1 Tax=Hibiscus syriacus TaxID=106335 RepID=UPI001920445D|nr:GDSL esterase/lipase At4g16230-like [Hibiscus syriacus]